jgi:hypothetical protein
MCWRFPGRGAVLLSHTSASGGDEGADSGCSRPVQFPTVLVEVATGPSIRPLQTAHNPFVGPAGWSGAMRRISQWLGSCCAPASAAGGDAVQGPSPEVHLPARELGAARCEDVTRRGYPLRWASLCSLPANDPTVARVLLCIHWLLHKPPGRSPAAVGGGTAAYPTCHGRHACAPRAPLFMPG